MVLRSVVFAWLLLASAVHASDVTYINKSNFKIPLQINPARRSEIKELKLAVSADQGATWSQEAVATPEQDGFPFFAKADGLYWFTVVVVDAEGNPSPAEPSKVPPGQKIVVDTRKPTVRLTLAERAGEDVLVGWDVQDENLNLNSLRVEWRAADSPELAPWLSVPLNATASGQTRFKPSTSKAVTVRVQVQDLAENLGSAQKDVPAAATGGATETASLPSSLAPVPPAPVSPAVAPASGVAATPGYPGDRPFVAGGSGGGWNGQAPQPYVGPASQPLPAAVAPASPPATGPVQQVVAQSGYGTAAAPVTPLGSLPPSGSGTAVQVTNKKQFALDYEVTEGGRSKLGAVELWVTQDNGQSWRYLCDDPDLQPPILVELPREGTYGFRLVLRSAAGLSYGPPQAGDLPEVLVEVDRTPPVAQLMKPQPDPQRDNVLVLTWNASDRNLAVNPISLEWAEHPAGAWHPIGAAALPNSGRFDWQLPENLPPHVYMRLIVRDIAGNVSEAVTREPILVDLRKPKGVLKGIVVNAVGTTLRPGQ
jgi:hypothetical protein